MLSDSLDDFVISSGKPDADLPALRDEFETQLNYYAHKQWGYSPKVFPLLRKAVRCYVAGKLSRVALEAAYDRTLLCYFCQEGSEEELVEDLRGHIRAKPSNDLPAVVSRMLSSRKVASTRPEQRSGSLHIVQHPHRTVTPAKIAGRAATTTSGVILKLVNTRPQDSVSARESERAIPTQDFLARRVLALLLAKHQIGELLSEAASFLEPGAPESHCRCSEICDALMLIGIWLCPPEADNDPPTHGLVVHSDKLVKRYPELKRLEAELEGLRLMLPRPKGCGCPKCRVPGRA